MKNRAERRAYARRAIKRSGSARGGALAKARSSLAVAVGEAERNVAAQLDSDSSAILPESRRAALESYETDTGRTEEEA